MQVIPYVPDGMQLADAAYAYAVVGLYVFPLAVGSKEPLRGSHGLLDATNDTEQVAAWWREEPRYNIGINCGRSRIIVIDVDPRNGGVANYSWLKDELSFRRSTQEVKTPSGGSHFYYTLPDDVPVPRQRIFAPGIDLQGDGAYVVAPPSETLQGAYVVTMKGVSPTPPRGPHGYYVF